MWESTLFWGLLAAQPDQCAVSLRLSLRGPADEPVMHPPADRTARPLAIYDQLRCNRVHHLNRN
jgi:hypothetical protein